MRLRVAVVAMAVAAAVLGAPTPALAAPDSLACTETGTYRRVVNGRMTTFWLIGTYGPHRYWHVAVPVASGVETYVRSYEVTCSAGAVVTSTEFGVTATSVGRCGTTSDLDHRYVGYHSHTETVGSFPLTYRYQYWYVQRFVELDQPGTWGYWVYDHSELIRCVF